VTNLRSDLGNFRHKPSQLPALKRVYELLAARL